MTTLLLDLRYALRSLTSRPGLSVLAVATLALGLAATIAVFSVVHAVLLSPLPFAEPERLARLYQVWPGRDIDEGSLSRLDAEDWAARSRTLAGVGLYSTLPSSLTLVGKDEPAELRTCFVSGGLFSLLGVEAQRGRTLTAADEAGDDRGVVLSHGAWQRRFGADPAVVGSTLTLDGEPFTVAGVMPPSFRFPDAEVEAWALLSLIPETSIPRTRFVRWLAGLGRLAPGATLPEAEAELTGIAGGLAREYPDSNGGAEAVNLVALREHLVGDVRPALLALFAAVGLVLAIACGNVANLLLARGVARQRGVAILSALGASRRRVLRQLLAESLLLALAGGAVGFLTAGWAVEALLVLAGGTLPRAGEVSLGGPVLAFALAASLATGLAFGIVPALRLSRADLARDLKDQVAGAGASGAQRRLRAALVAAEMALAVALVVGAGLVVKSLWRLTRVDPGFDPQGLLAVGFTFPSYKYGEEEAFIGAYHAVLERVAAVPGVDSVASIKVLSFRRGDEQASFTIAGEPEPPRGQEPLADMYPVSPGIFTTLGVPLLSGRSIAAEDREGAPFVAVANQALARRYFAGENPVGRRLRVGRGELEVVGLAGDVKHASLTDPARPALYVSQEQVSRIVFTLLVRTGREPLEVAAAVRRAIWEVDPDQPISQLGTVSDLMGEAILPSRFFTLLFSIFAALALALAALGVYGVLSFEVGQRRREIGVRIAVGAGRGQVLGMVLRQGMAVAIAGVALGVAGALALSRLLERLLFEVGTRDPLVFAAVPAFLLLVAAAACYLPGRRAARVDPVVALRLD